MRGVNLSYLAVGVKWVEGAVRPLSPGVCECGTPPDRSGARAVGHGREGGVCIEHVPVAGSGLIVGLGLAGV